MILLDGKSVAEKILSAAKKEIDDFKRGGFRPRLAVVLVGDDPASVSYIEVKRKKALELGIDFDLRIFPMSTSQDELCENIRQLNHIKDAAGIIVQLPLPAGLSRQEILDCILPELDIDGLTSASQENLKSGESGFVPPTPAAILAILEAYGLSLEERRVAIVGAGDLVGKPMAVMLNRRGVHVESFSRSAENFKPEIARADMVISGAGKPNLITADMIKPGAIVIDAGTTFVAKKGKVRLCGDVAFSEVSKKAGYITPVPGGVGPVTVAMLFKNFANSCKLKAGKIKQN